MGAGAARSIAEKYPYIRGIKPSSVGTCCLYINVASNRRIFNLVTKQYFYEKPTTEYFERALMQLKQKIIDSKIRYLNITKLGCGRDMLDWDSFVLPLLQKVFKNCFVELHVYYGGGNLQVA
jgi:hypothetical protein